MGDMSRCQHGDAISYCDKCELSAQSAQLERLRGALEPFAKLKIIGKEGTARAYWIKFSVIKAAREALAASPTPSGQQQTVSVLVELVARAAATLDEAARMLRSIKFPEMADRLRALLPPSNQERMGKR